jgi:SAM-dependent methyltransferase
MSGGNWHRAWFDQDYLALYPHRDPAEAETLLDTLSSAGLLPEPATGGPVLDLGCGAGRHSRALARRGHRVIGLDWSLPLLLKARADGNEVAWVRGDMGRPPFRRGAGLVLSLFTSLGYSDDDAENARVWRGVLGLPRPGGRLVLDYLNPVQLERGLVPRSRRTAGEWVVDEERCLLPASRQVQKILRFGPPGGPRREVVERVKLYGPDWFHEPARAAGFRRLAHWGDLHGAPWTDQSPRSLQVWEAR